LVGPELIVEWFVQILHQNFVYELETHGISSNLEVSEDTGVVIGGFGKSFFDDERRTSLEF
jgi:hypothetical protein